MADHIIYGPPTPGEPQLHLVPETWPDFFNGLSASIADKPLHYDVYGGPTHLRSSLKPTINSSKSPTVVVSRLPPNFDRTQYSVRVNLEGMQRTEWKGSGPFTNTRDFEDHVEDVEDEDDQHAINENNSIWFFKIFASAALDGTPCCEDIPAGGVVEFDNIKLRNLHGYSSFVSERRLPNDQRNAWPKRLDLRVELWKKGLPNFVHSVKVKVALENMSEGILRGMDVNEAIRFPEVREEMRAGFRLPSPE